MSVGTSGGYPMHDKLISESDVLTSPDSRSLSNRGKANESLADETTGVISCRI